MKCDLKGTIKRKNKPENKKDTERKVSLKINDINENIWSKKFKQLKFQAT